jgi:hypothetical protein
MRISEIDLQCEDLMWFAIDINGNVFECTSAGCGNVPEYVCKSREDTNALLDYFTAHAPVITTAKLLLPVDESDLVADVTDLASKGVYCFDITDYDNEDCYHCVAIPERALSIKDLPQDIQNLLCDHIYSGNVSQERSIAVTHAYE